METLNIPAFPQNRAKKSTKKLSSDKKQYSADKIVGFEKLLFQILTKFTGLIIDNFEKEIKEAIKLVVEHLDFDRGTLFEFIDAEDTLKVILFYAHPGVPAPYTTKISTTLPQYTSEIKKGEVMFFSRRDEMSEKYIRERELAKAIKLKSNIDGLVKSQRQQTLRSLR